MQTTAAQGPQLGSEKPTFFRLRSPTGPKEYYREPEYSFDLSFQEDFNPMSQPHESCKGTLDIKC